MAIASWLYAVRNLCCARIAGTATAIAIVTLLALVLPATWPAAANQDIFNKTGEPCTSCHVPPVSNGALNPHGQDFKTKFFGTGGAPQVVVPQCPPGFMLSGSQCIQIGAAPAPMPAAPPVGAAGADCNQLWFARNSIFASKGFCFNTPRGKAAFPRNCFPPFGQLTGAEQAQVGGIKARESAMGCR